MSYAVFSFSCNLITHMASSLAPHAVQMSPFLLCHLVVCVFFLHDLMREVQTLYLDIKLEDKDRLGMIKNTLDLMSLDKRHIRKVMCK